MSLFYYINLVKHKKILLSKVIEISYNLEREGVRFKATIRNYLPQDI